MSKDFQVLTSNKVGLQAEEGYVVVRNHVAFLRILGGEPVWNLMTATADEDHGRILVCPDRRRLVQSAFRLCYELGGSAPRVETDMAGREYVKICTITREPGESDEVFHAGNNGLFARFFEIFDSYEASSGPSEMRELYDALASDEAGEDIYLSDGVWLTEDGLLQDRGR